MIATVGFTAFGELAAMFNHYPYPAYCITVIVSALISHLLTPMYVVFPAIDFAQTNAAAVYNTVEKQSLILYSAALLVSLIAGFVIHRKNSTNNSALDSTYA